MSNFVIALRNQVLQMTMRLKEILIASSICSTIENIYVSLKPKEPVIPNLNAIIDVKCALSIHIRYSSWKT